VDVTAIWLLVSLVAKYLTAVKEEVGRKKSEERVGI